MTGPATTHGCQVTLLIPHPDRVAVLVADEPEDPRAAVTPGRVRMPSLWLDDEEPLLSTILDSTELLDADTAVVLRQVITSGAGEDDEDEGLSLVVELDAGGTESPAGWRWQDLDDDVIARTEPGTAREVLAAWSQERTEGWSPLRPPWARPGWFADASAWMTEQMATDGHPPLSPPRQHQLWGLSVVLRARSAVGDVFFKSSAEIFRQEAAVTQALATRMPDLTPEVITADATRGWLLMRDLAATELGEQDESLWHEGVAALATIQQQWLGRTEELVALGLPVRSLTDLAVQIHELTQDAALLGQMSSGLRDEWLATVPALLDSVRRLDEIGPGESLVHGDFHPWNVTLGAEGLRVFDWTDAAVSHPFVDLATFVFRTRDVSVRRRLVDAWVAAWSDVLPDETVHEAASLGLVVGALYQVQTYRLLLPALMADGADDGMAGGDVAWLNRSLVRHRLGIESPH